MEKYDWKSIKEDIMNGEIVFEFTYGLGYRTSLREASRNLNTELQKDGYDVNVMVCTIKEKGEYFYYMYDSNQLSYQNAQQKAKSVYKKINN